ncbi:hypothetical protein CCACVL1_25049 [Corchorus capsularis]|uniref:Uncharacterized protein n=1 Tax=Corchorus capsularis TaxID=210143 RepID=A0A1R3GM17_COCAP|nr:hypothetical protein CCACVL1_25049 [Corchorus capsularis]
MRQPPSILQDSAVVGVREAQISLCFVADTRRGTPVLHLSHGRGATGFCLGHGRGAIVFCLCHDRGVIGFRLRHDRGAIEGRPVP